MGSRPSSRRRGDENSNGSAGNELETDLRAENAKLLTKIAELEQRHKPDEIHQENEQLRKENERLKQQLNGTSHRLQQPETDPIWKHHKNNEQLKEIKSLNDFRVSEQKTEANGTSELQRTKSDITNNYVDRTKDISPLFIRKSKQPRKINPSSVPQRMSDIDAYGQGLPLPDTEKLRKHIRRTKKKKQRTDSGNSTGSSASHVTENCNGNERAPSSPERTDQHDVFLGVENLQSGADDSDRSFTSEAGRDDLLM